MQKLVQQKLTTTAKHALAFVLYRPMNSKATTYAPFSPLLLCFAFALREWLYSPSTVHTPMSMRTWTFVEGDAAAVMPDKCKKTFRFIATCKADCS